MGDEESAESAHRQPGDSTLMGSGGATNHSGSAIDDVGSIVDDDRHRRTGSVRIGVGCTRPKQNDLRRRIGGSAAEHPRLG